MQGPCSARPSCSCSKIRSRNKKNLAYLYMRMRRRIGGDMPPSTLSVHGWLLLGATSPPPLAARVLHRIDRHASHTLVHTYLTRARSRTYCTCTVGHGQGPCAWGYSGRLQAIQASSACLFTAGQLHTDSRLRSLPLIGPQTCRCLSSTFMHNRSPWPMFDMYLEP